jgi:precorrin-6A synthase
LARDVGAFLLWGEPALYDSTLRIRPRTSARPCAGAAGDSRHQQHPGPGGRHQVPLNRIGEPLTVLPGRRLAGQARIDNVLVMLDGQCAFATLEDRN